MRFLTNSLVLKTPNSWYLNQTFWWKTLKTWKNGEKWGKVEQFFYFTVKKHMQHFIKIPQKMMAGFLIFKLVKPPLSVDLLFEFNWFKTVPDNLWFDLNLGCLVFYLFSGSLKKIFSGFSKNTGCPTKHDRW